VLIRELQSLCLDVELVKKKVDITDEVEESVELAVAD
jgi:hypothetical protein